MQQRDMSDSSTPTVPIRPAASLLVLRSTADGVEVLTLKRAANMRFLPGFLSFPGGGIDENDYVIAQERWTGTLLQQEQTDDPAYAAGALRECAEETGIAFALQNVNGRRQTLPLPAGTQAQILSSQLEFLDFLREGSWWVNGGALRFVGSWTTPPGLPIRYETRFFACQAAAEEVAIRINDKESAWGQWRNPSKLLHDIQTGNAKAAPPTMAMLKALAKCGTAQECMSTLTVLPPSPEELAKLARKLTQS